VDALKKAAPYLVTAIVAAVLVGVIFDARDSSGGEADFEARIPPVEFLYLDGERVLKFLAELEGGEVGAVHRISKEINSVDAKVSQAGFEGGASSQRETSAESTITRTESSALGLLLAELEDNDREGIEYHPIPLREETDLDGLREGMLVKFVTHHLLSPGYIRPYVVLRQSATLAALFPREANNEADAAKSKAQRRKAESFVRQVGPDPRLTFAISPPSPDPEEQPLKVLLPMQYRGLTEERSLLEKGRDEYTGGRLEVIGKVIRVFRQPTDCAGGRDCAGEIPEYTDWGTREIWRNPIEQASRYLINHVSHSCEMPRSDDELEELSEEISPMLRGRACFLHKLNRQTELFAPGAVVLPLAIYK
jgi:hypothetical protein